jgi:hypothetical protein
VLGRRWVAGRRLITGGRLKAGKNKIAGRKLMAGGRLAFRRLMVRKKCATLYILEAVDGDLCLQVSNFCSSRVFEQTACGWHLLSMPSQTSRKV